MVIALLLLPLPSAPLKHPGEKFPCVYYSAAAAGKVSRHRGPPANHPSRPGPVSEQSPFLGIDDVTFDNYVKDSNEICFGGGRMLWRKEKKGQVRKEDGTKRTEEKTERGDDDDRGGKGEENEEVMKMTLDGLPMRQS